MLVSEILKEEEKALKAAKIFNYDDDDDEEECDFLNSSTHSDASMGRSCHGFGSSWHNNSDFLSRSMSNGDALGRSLHNDSSHGDFVLENMDEGATEIDPLAEIFLQEVLKR